MDMLENAYGINLLPLAVFSDVTYRDAAVFRPRVLPAGHSLPRDSELFSRMHKAMCVIMFKLEGQIIARRPEYQMSDRDMLSRINYQNGTIEIDGTVYPLRDTDFPTIDPADPNKLTPEEQDIIDGLVSSFRRSEKLQIHTRFLYSVGSIYRRHNGNLLYHGCIPCDGNGEFMEFSLYSDTPLKGRAFLDWADRLARQGYFAPDGSMERLRGLDFLWFLWCGRNSPICGRTKITTFERALIEDKASYTEPKNPYYVYYGSEEFCRRILDDFDLHKPWSRIINGHMPVKVKEGEDPRKGGRPPGSHRRRLLQGLPQADRHSGLHNVLQLPRNAHRRPRALYHPGGGNTRQEGYNLTFLYSGKSSPQAHDIRYRRRRGHKAPHRGS